MARAPLPPLQPGWLIVDGRPLYHRYAAPAPDRPAVVHVHGFGVSGTYLEPTAARLANLYRTYVPDLPGTGRSFRPERTLDVPGLARALIAYCDEVGVERATFVGNSLGCALICEIASAFPDRIDRAVLVSPAGGVTNRPLARAVGQLALDGPREPLSMVPIAVRDYLRFGVLQGLSLFAALTRYPTLDRLQHLSVPTLVVVGDRDPLVRVERAHVLSPLPHVDAVTVPGAHALNFSSPDIVAALVEAHIEARPLHEEDGVLSATTVVPIPARSSGADEDDARL